MTSLSANDLVHTAKMTFAQIWLPRKIISDAGMKNLNIQQSITSSYHYQSNGQVEACIKYVNSQSQKDTGTTQDTNLALL